MTEASDVIWDLYGWRSSAVSSESEEWAEDEESESERKSEGSEDAAFFAKREERLERFSSCDFEFLDEVCLWRRFFSLFFFF